MLILSSPDFLLDMKEPPSVISFVVRKYSSAEYQQNLYAASPVSQTVFLCRDKSRTMIRGEFSGRSTQQHDEH